MSTLHELTALSRRLRDLMFEDDTTEDQLVELANEFAEIDAAIEDKALAYAQVFSRTETEIQAIKAEEERLKNRRKVIENGKSRLEQRFAALCLDDGREKIETTLTTITIRENARVELASGVTPAKLPEQFVKLGAPSKSANLTALREALERGEATEYAALHHGVSIR